MGYVYLDANPVVTWADAQAPTADVEWTELAKLFAAVLDGPDQLGVSELGLLEVFNKLAVHVRRNESQFGACDEVWFKSVRSEIMGWLHEGRVSPLPTPPRLFEHAMLMVEMATREHNNALRSWDAAHIHQAVVWSRTVEAAVTILTSDKGLAGFLALYPEYGRHVVVRDLRAELPSAGSGGPPN